MTADRDFRDGEPVRNGLLAGQEKAWANSYILGYRAGLKEAAEYHDRRAQDFRVLMEYTGGDAKRQAERSAEIHEKSAQAIREYISRPMFHGNTVHRSPDKAIQISPPKPEEAP